MDESDVKKPDGELNPPSYNLVMGRTMLSAGIFGALGWRLGGWLGKRGNAPKNGIADSIMKWGLGIFSAILAACSSLKASEYSEPALRSKTKTPSSDAQKDQEPEEPKEEQTYGQKIPLSSIQSVGAEQQKVLDASQVQQLKNIFH